MMVPLNFMYILFSMRFLASNVKLPVSQGPDMSLPNETLYPKVLKYWDT